jgi:hypothetical protein
MKTTIEPYEELNDWEDGDWEVKFYLEEGVLVTYVGAGNPDSAITQAQDRLNHILTVEQPEEVVVKLKGIYK